MWLGLEKLGLAKLNIKNSSDVFEKVSFLENIFSVLNSGKNIKEDIYFYEKINLDHPPLSIGIIEEFNLSESFFQNSSCKINVYEIIENIENTTIELNTSKYIYEDLIFQDDINKNINLYKDISEILSYQERIYRILHRMKVNIREEDVTYSEYVNAEITGSNLEMNAATFQSSIPRGKTLYINSNTYNVLLDNQNSIDKYNGEWIFISPETLKINIQPKNNNMEVWIEYQELFL